MNDSKYTTFGETPQAFECTNENCGWIGDESEKAKVRTDPEYPIFEHVCPECGNEEFYGLTDKSEQ